MRWLGENVGSPPLHSSSSPSSWLQWMTTSSPTFQRFTLAPTAQTMPAAAGAARAHPRRRRAAGPVGLVTVETPPCARLPALPLGADRPDDARGVRAGDVKGLLVHVEWTDRQA